MAAENLIGLIGFVELRACIAELEDTRTTAERVLRALQSRQVQIRQLEENKHRPYSSVTRGYCPTLWMRWIAPSATGYIKCPG